MREEGGGVKSVDEGGGRREKEVITHSLYHPPAISSQTLGVVFCALGHVGSSSFSPCDESQLETVFH